MVVGYKNTVPQPSQKDSLNKNKNQKIMDKESYDNEKVDKNAGNYEVSCKEYLEEKSNNDLLRISSDSNCWWSNDSEGKLDSSQRWSFGSDISIEAVENIQNRLCCSPVDEFDSTVSSENEDLIVNNTEESESFKPCIKVMCTGNTEKQHKTSDDDTADDELIDYSKRYTTDSSSLTIENKSNAHVPQQQQRRNMVMNPVARSGPAKKSVSTRSKVYPFGDYAETDLDQPTDYSLRYAEEDTDDEEKEEPHFYCTNEQEDTVKTYYTEGTPSNFSTATSMSDLLTLEDPREGDESYKRQFLRAQKQIVEQKEAMEKSEKTTKDCKNRMRRKFVAEDTKSLITEKSQEISTQHPRERKLEKLRTPPQSPAEVCDKGKDSKGVNFQVDDNYAQETPLMFSRSSSLDSLSEFEQNSIQDDRSSVVSDFSHRTSGAVSPSELPDSPTQTVPPSPRRLQRDNFSNLQQQQRRLAQAQAQPRLDRDHFQNLQQQPLAQSQSQPQARTRTGRDNFQHQPIPQQRAQSQSQSRPQPQLPPQPPAQRVPPRPAPRKPTTQPQPESRTGQRQVPLMERSQPDGCASLVQQPVNDGRGSQRHQLNGRTLPAQQPNARIAERCFSVFEDGLVRFKEESTPGKHSSAASSLSALTIDDEEDDNLDNREIISRIAAIRVRSSATGMHQAPSAAQRQGRAEGDKFGGQPTANGLNGNCGFRSNGSYISSPAVREATHRVDAVEESNDYTTSYSNKEIQNNRYGELVEDIWYDNCEPKAEERNQANGKQTSTSPMCNRTVNGDNEAARRTTQKPTYTEAPVAVDTLRVYYTEDTPIYASPYGSQSNLSALSLLSFSDDDNPVGYGPTGDLERNSPDDYEPEEEETAERSNSRANSYDSEARSALSDDEAGEEEDEDKRYAGSAAAMGAMHRRIDVSPFESQMNLNFALLRIEEEDEEEAKADETDGATKNGMPLEDSDEEDDEDVYRRLSRQNSECSDDEEERQVLEQCIKSGVSKITRRSLESGSVP